MNNKKSMENYIPAFPLVSQVIFNISLEVGFTFHTT